MQEKYRGDSKKKKKKKKEISTNPERQIFKIFTSVPTMVASQRDTTLNTLLAHAKKTLSTALLLHCSIFACCFSSSVTCVRRRVLTLHTTISWQPKYFPVIRINGPAKNRTVHHYSLTTLCI